MKFIAAILKDCHSEEQSDEESRFSDVICTPKDRFFAEFILSQAEGLRMTSSYLRLDNMP
jgi:hypothetical protein